jgi:hypothetical protein
MRRIETNFIQKNSLLLPIVEADRSQPLRSGADEVRLSSLEGAPMSFSASETFLRNAKQQLSQTDINQSLIRAVSELLRQVKDMEQEIHRVKRSVQMSRRF